jgi:hypothetical protein
VPFFFPRGWRVGVLPKHEEEHGLARFATVICGHSRVLSRRQVGVSLPPMWRPLWCFSPEFSALSSPNGTTPAMSRRPAVERKPNLTLTRV